MKIRDLRDVIYSAPPPPPKPIPGNHIAENKEILIGDMLKRLGLGIKDIIDMKPEELRARIRDNKLDSIL